MLHTSITLDLGDHSERKVPRVMGMYDELHCNYPLPGTPAVIQQATFQTKAFHRTLEHYTITEDGQLIYHQEHREWEPDESSLFGGYLKLVNVVDVLLPYHGDIRFYTSLEQPEHSREREWWEFEARFTEGQLTRIRRLSPPSS